MASMTLDEWLTHNRAELIKRFAAAASQPADFPTYSSLSAEALRAVVEREFIGLHAFMIADQQQIQEATQEHKRQAENYLRGLTLDEHFSFFQKRLEILLSLVEKDAATKDFREEFYRRLESAKRFYRTISLTIDTSQKLSRMFHNG